MKKQILTFLFCNYLIFNAFSQMAMPCNNLEVDLVKGTIKGLKPTANRNDIKKTMPCFTGDTEEGSDINCGGGIFFNLNNFFFYTGKDYIEFRENFKGNMSIDLIGKKFDDVIKPLTDTFGSIADQYEDEGLDLQVFYYQTSYGSLRINYNLSNKKIIEVGIHAKGPMEAKKDLCL